MHRLRPFELPQFIGSNRLRELCKKYSVESWQPRNTQRFSLLAFGTHRQSFACLSLRLFSDDQASVPAQTELVECDDSSHARRVGLYGPENRGRWCFAVWCVDLGDEEHSHLVNSGLLLVCLQHTRSISQHPACKRLLANRPRPQRPVFSEVRPLSHGETDSGPSAVWLVSSARSIWSKSRRRAEGSSRKSPSSLVNNSAADTTVSNHGERSVAGVGGKSETQCRRLRGARRSAVTL